MRKIRQISVTNLFGMFTHVIPFNLEDHVTIIHSPNGFGKTMMLRLLNELFSKGNNVLRTTPFDEFHISFEDNSQFWVTRNLESASENGSRSKARKTSTPKIMFYFHDHHGEQSFTLKSSKVMRDALPTSMIERVIPELDRIGIELWRNSSTGDILSAEEVFERYSDQLVAFSGLSASYEKDPDWLREIRADIPIRFIETQRLLNPDPKKMNRLSGYERTLALAPTVTMYAEELAEIIKTKLAESTALSQSLDRAFPKRLVSAATRPSDITETELRHKLAQLETKRASLMATGLIDKDDSDVVHVGDRIDESTRTTLEIYVEDTEKKLGIFEELAEKLDAFSSIINRRFLYKHISINKEKGYVFTTANGTNLSLTNLSSGEQHELVLFYELLFKSSPGSLILIDEPEISLHIVWQEQFLNDVQEIARLANIDVLLATHSADIIDGRRDLLVELKGPSNGRA